MIYFKETCDCEDCLDGEFPCSLDCDVDLECIGCATSREEIKDIQFEIDKAQGRY